MNLETAAILFRHHADDFVLWCVDLPAALLRDAKHMENTAYGDLDFVMEQLPVRPEKDVSVLHLLFREGEYYSLFTQEVDPGFVAAQRRSGYSVRGGKEDIMEDVLQHFHDLTPVQNMVM